MLKRLYIENIAVIEYADISFMDGFNVLSGETGAGKSIIIDALNAILGNRVSRELIRTGQTKACVSATFCDLSPQALAEAAQLGYESEVGGRQPLRRGHQTDGPEEEDVRVPGAHRG